MEYVLFFVIFSVFFLKGECMECFRCHVGNNTFDTYNNNFPISLCWTYNNPIADHVRCETACMKLKITENGSESIIYDCHDGFSDNKFKNIVVIKSIFACYSDFCNGEYEWRNHSSKDMDSTDLVNRPLDLIINSNSNSTESVKKSDLLPPYTFWIILGVSFAITLVIQLIRSIYGFDDKETFEQKIPLAKNRTRLSKNII